MLALKRKLLKLLAPAVIPRICLVLTSSQRMSLWVEPELSWKPHPIHLKVDIGTPTALTHGSLYEVVSCSRFLLSFAACVSVHFHSRMPLESNQPDPSACSLPSQLRKLEAYSNNRCSRCFPCPPARLINALNRYGRSCARVLLKVVFQERCQLQLSQSDGGQQCRSQRPSSSGCQQCPPRCGSLALCRFGEKSHL